MTKLPRRLLPQGITTWLYEYRNRRSQIELAVSDHEVTHVESVKMRTSGCQLGVLSYRR